MGIRLIALAGLAALAFGVGQAGAAAKTRDAAKWPFAATSPWNTPIGSGAAYEDSGACSTAITGTPTSDVNAAQWSHSVTVAKGSDPLQQIYVGDQVVATIRIPATATPTLPSYADGGDAHLHIVDPTHTYVDELWQARPADGGWRATSHTRNRLRGSGIGAGGERAYGGSAIGGLIRSTELRAGKIPHALAFALPRARQRVGFVWPAPAEDDGAATTYRGSVPMGTLAAIPPSVDVTTLGLSAPGLAVARTLQNYGAYDVDSSQDFTLYAEPSAEPLAGPLRSDLPTLQRVLRCVTNNSAATPGGPGKRRAALAPPFAKPPKPKRRK